MYASQKIVFYMIYLQSQVGFGKLLLYNKVMKKEDISTTRRDKSEVDDNHDSILILGDVIVSVLQ